MLWLRNLLLVGVVGGGLIALIANLMPASATKPATSFDLDAYSKREFRDSVDGVNRLIREEQKTENAKRSEPAADLLVARRLSLGLMGTVPSLEEIRQFEALPANERLPWYIDHILQDRRFSDYLAERLARAFVGTEDGPFVFFRRRRFVNWLEEQLVKNRPYDQMVRDLIASEGLWTDKPATNFVSVTCRPEKGNQPDPIRLAGRITRGFLGMRIDCAQCHNHPFAKWKQTDFDGLSAFFGQTHVGFTGIYDGPGEYSVEDVKTLEKRVVVPRVPYSPELLPQQGSTRDRLAGWVTHPKNPFFARATVNRMWALLFGKPLVAPVDNLDPDAEMPKVLQFLSDDFVAHEYDLRRLIRVIACTEAFRADSAADFEVGEAEEKTWAVFPMTRLRPEQMAGSVEQSGSVATLDAKSHILIRLAVQSQENEFIQRYGDTGEDEFEGRGGTIPQRLLMMNGKLVRERIAPAPGNATARIAWMSPSDPHAIEVAYLAALSRRPTDEEKAHFEAALSDKGKPKGQHLEDLYWALINSTEFSWNH